MRNFGKFAPFLDETGFCLHNSQEQILTTVLADNPHPFYIAVDDMSRVIEMTNDPTKIHIPGFEIIGIDSDFGFTHGEDGNVYGAIWNGEAIIAPPPVQPVLTARQFWLAALELGITEDGLVASIADPDDPLYIEEIQERASALIDIHKATSFRRNYPLVDEMALAFGLSTVEMDSLWAWAAQIE